MGNLKIRLDLNTCFSVGMNLHSRKTKTKAASNEFPQTLENWGKYAAIKIPETKLKPSQSRGMD
jgi:hypothetical protein